MDLGKHSQMITKSLDNDDSISRIVGTFSRILEDLVCLDPEEPEVSEKVLSSASVFACKKPPKIALKDYLIRILKYSEMESSTLLASLILLDSFCRTQVSITNLSIHRLLITSIVVAIKMYEDTIYKNDYYANIGGIRLELLNSMELAFIELLDYRLHINPETFESYKKLVELAKSEYVST